MSSKETQDMVRRYVDKFGDKQLQEYLSAKLNENNLTLTLIGNAGLHSVPAEFMHGVVYEVTRGNLDLSSKESALSEYQGALSSLVKKLRERTWEKVYFVPTGHTTLVLQIKLIVYHVLRLSTIDLFYQKGKYFEIDFDYRQLLIGGDT